MKPLHYLLFLLLTAAVWAQEADEASDLEVFQKKPRHRTATRFDRSRGEIVKIGASYTLKTNETARSVVIIGNDAIIDGEVDEVVVISGSARINGTVHRDVVVILGEAEIGPKGKVGHQVVAVGGALKAHPDASIGREPFELSLPGISSHIGSFNRWFATGLLLGRPLPPVTWAWAAAGIVLAFYLLVAALFPRPVSACVTSLEDHPASSLLAGILGLILIGPVSFLLAASVIGIPAIPLLLCGLVLSVLFGKVALLQYIGQRVLTLGGPSLASSTLLAILLGGLVLSVFYMVPVLGFGMVGLSALFGFGAALMALGQKFKRENPASSNPVVLAGSLAAGVAASEGGVPPTITTEGGIATGPQAVYMERAGFWIRLCATLLDLLLVGSLGFLVGPFIIPALVGYFVGMWAWKGTTVGGIVLGLKVVRTDGRPIDFAVALVRSLASLFSIAVLFLGFFWAGWDRDKQSWHDKIAGTVIVKVPKGMSLI